METETQDKHEVDLSKPQSSAQIPPEMNEETGLATRDSMAVGLQDATALPDMQGIAPPRLSLAYGVGGLAVAGFNPGDLVLAREHLLATKAGPAIRVICLKFEQYWKEYLSTDLFNSGVRPRTWATKPEVQKDGLTTEWVAGRGPQASLAMDWFMLIERPEGVKCGLFGIEIAGKAYAPAVMTFDKSIYNSVAQTFLPAASFALRKRRVYSAIWGMLAKMVPSRKPGGNAKWIIQLSLADHLPDETVKEIVSIFGTSPVVPVAVADVEPEAF